MDFKNIIADLVCGGMTQKEIASFCECGQSTISEIANGEIKNPSYRIGIALTKLQQSRALIERRPA